MSFLLSQQNSEGVDEFAIDLHTGVMTVRNCELLDFDNKKTSYSIVVEARDNYRVGITRKYFVNYLFGESCSYFYFNIKSAVCPLSNESTSRKNSFHKTL